MNPKKLTHTFLAIALVLVVFAPALFSQDRSAGEVTPCGLPVVELQPSFWAQGALGPGDCLGPDGSYVEVYKFTKSSENTSHTIRLESTAFQPSIRIYNSAAALVADGSSTPGLSVASIGIEPPIGTYYVFVKSNGPGGIGSYQVRLSVVIVDIFPSPTFNYDGSFGADKAVYRPSNRTWYIERPGAPTRAFGWGEPDDKLMPADYDGDGLTDLAVFRPSSGVWHIVESASGTFRQVAWGQSGDIPVAGGYQFSRSDLVVFRPSEGAWYIRAAADDSFQKVFWGQAGDVPVYADFDSDERMELTVFRPSEGRWYFRSQHRHWTADWGQAGDIPVPDDYDNDGRVDLAVYRPASGRWFLIKSRTGHIQVTAWGEPGDIPVPDDYYFDGSADLAVFRPSTGEWLVKSFSGPASFNGVTRFGEPGDIPAQAHHILR